MSALRTSPLHSPESSWHVSAAYQLGKINKQDFLRMDFQNTGINMQGMCSFEKGFEGLFPLLKGFMALGKPDWLIVTWSKSEKTAFFYFPQEKEQEVKDFLGRVIAMLEKEIQFKTVLEQVILNRKRFATEQVILVKALMNKV